MSLIKPKKNRNIKGLQIAQDAAKPGTNTNKPAPNNNHSRGQQPGGSGSGSYSDSSSPSMPSSALSSATTSSGAPHQNNASSSKAAKLSEHLATLELGIEFKLDLRPEDLELIQELGAGNGGTVTRVRHVPTGAIMAKKVVHIDAKPAVRKQIVRELQIMHDCSSKYIVSFYGAYLNDPQICMCMEMMDKGALDSAYKKTGPFNQDILGKVAVAVVSGLTYLYDAHRIIHRDVKPSNVLVNSLGQIKICDFGVSGELINSVADTFVGTSTYMSPERIQGAAYTVKSDVWSLGIMLIELALGRFPFAPEEESESEDQFDGDDTTLSPVQPKSKEAALAKAEAQRSERRSMQITSSGSRMSCDEPNFKTLQPNKKSSKKSKPKSSGGGGHGGMSILELLQHVVNEPAPMLPEGKFDRFTEQFVDACLLKDVQRRPTPKQLMKYPWFVAADKQDVDLEAWASTL